MEELTGNSAESFETTVRRYSKLPFARQTFANRLKAFVDFNLVPIYPAYDIKSYERQLELPIPSQPLYCMEDSRWKQSHLEQMLEQRIRSSNTECIESRPIKTGSAEAFANAT
jgi:hypothetical protein